MSTASSKASEYIKRCMGGGPDDALLFCGSGATSSIKGLQEVLGIAVPSIMRERVVKGSREEERWVVFIGPFEHHSNLLSWRQSLVDVVGIGMDDEAQVDMETLRTELESSKYVNRPMLGSFSACSNVTGVYTNTRALARLLHQHGAFACFDFATRVVAIFRRPHMLTCLSTCPVASKITQAFKCDSSIRIGAF